MIGLYTVLTSILLADFLDCLLDLHFDERGCLWERCVWHATEGPASSQIVTEDCNPTTCKELSAANNC